jgi:hypothetical protein
MTLLREFLYELKRRNYCLYMFGIVNFLIAGFLILSSFFVQADYLGTHAYFKPAKFGLAQGTYSWTMAWLCFYLNKDFNLKQFNWIVVILFGFEILYITFQALRGEQSHYNLTSSLYYTLYNLMGVAAAIVTLYTAYIGYLFFHMNPNSLKSSYLWGIRLGIVIFVIFSFEGGIMAAQLHHTVGAKDGSEGILFVNWSKKFGDLRISHFFGMHALQVLPLAGHFLFASSKKMIFFCAGYFMFVLASLLIALQGIGYF